MAAMAITAMVAMEPMSENTIIGNNNDNGNCNINGNNTNGNNSYGGNGYQYSLS